MNKIIFLATAIIALLSASCNSEIENADRQILVPVTVQVKGFTASVDSFDTRAAEEVSDYESVKAITLAFYNGTTEVYKTSQFRNSTTSFGHFSLSLPVGSYTMMVLGYGLNDGEPAITLTSPTEATFGDYPARETFVATQSVSITNTSAINLSATLNRAISKLHVESTDYKTANAVSVRMTFSGGGKSFNPTTGFATSNTGFCNTVALTTADGEVSQSNSYLFLTAEQQTMDVTIDVLDSKGNTVSHKVVNNVPFRRNRKTSLKGSLYTAGVAGAFEVNTEWGGDIPVSF